MKLQNIHSFWSPLAHDAPAIGARLCIESPASGWVRVYQLDDNTPLDLEALVDQWISREYQGEFTRDGELMPKLQGDYYSWIVTDDRPWDSPIVWESGGFYLTSP